MVHGKWFMENPVRIWLVAVYPPRPEKYERQLGWWQPPNLHGKISLKLMATSSQQPFRGFFGAYLRKAHSSCWNPKKSQPLSPRASPKTDPRWHPHRGWKSYRPRPGQLRGLANWLTKPWKKLAGYFAMKKCWSSIVMETFTSRLYEALWG